MTQAEAILAGILTLLEGASTGAVALKRSHTPPFSRAQTPAINVKPAEEQGQPIGTDLSRNDFTIELEVHAVGDVPDSIADPVVQKAHAALAKDPTLGGLCRRIFYTGRKWEFEDGDQARVKVTLSYQLQYLTDADDLGSQSI